MISVQTYTQTCGVPAYIGSHSVLVKVLDSSWGISRVLPIDMVGGPVVSFETVGVLPEVLMNVGAGLGGNVLQMST